MDRRNGIIFFAWLFLFFPSKAQQHIKGSGYVLTQQRETPAFNRIEVSDEITVFIVQGEAQPITVEADDNLFPYIKTVVRDEVLKIYITDTIRIAKFADLNVLISMPDLLGLKAMAKGKIDASPQHWKLKQIELKVGTGGSIKLHAYSTTLQIQAQTSGWIELKGRTEELNANLKTAARLYAQDFEAQNAHLDLATRAKAEVRVYGEVSYELSGNSKLLLLGKPLILKSQLLSGSKVVYER